MAIDVLCTQCNTVLKAPDEAAGKKVRCPDCNIAYPVPATNTDPVQQPGKSPSGDVLLQAEDFGKKAYQTARTATGHARQAFEILMQCPETGQPKALELLGTQRILQAAIVFNIAFAASLYLILKTVSSPWAAYGQSGDTTKMLLATLVPSIAFTAAMAAVDKLACGKLRFETSLFCIGVAFLPACIANCLSWLIGAKNFELQIVLQAFAACGFIILIHASLRHVLTLKEKTAFFVTPLLILASCYLVKVIFAALM